MAKEELLLIDQKGLAILLGVSQPTVQRMQHDGLLPAAVVLNKRCVRWRSAEIRAWLEAGAPPRVEWEAQLAALASKVQP